MNAAMDKAQSDNNKPENPMFKDGAYLLLLVDPRSKDCGCHLTGKGDFENMVLYFQDICGKIVNAYTGNKDILIQLCDDILNVPRDSPTYKSKYLHNKDTIEEDLDAKASELGLESVKVRQNVQLLLLPDPRFGGY